MNLRLKRTPGLFVVGFMGAGKTTVARHLAHRMGWNFCDTDQEIERAGNRTIAEIFDGDGEAEFRRIETGIIRQHVRFIERGRPAVMALGGGAFAEPANRQILSDNGISIWLDCPFAVVERRVAENANRPLARDPARFAALFESRREHYRLADVHVRIESDDPAVTVETILEHPVLR